MFDIKPNTISNYAIYLIVECDNKQMFDYVKEKYFNGLYIYSLKIMKQKFHNMPYEDSDIKWMLWEYFDQIILEYDYAQNEYNFNQYLFLKVKYYIYRYCKKFFTKKQFANLNVVDMYEIKEDNYKCKYKVNKFNDYESDLINKIFLDYCLSIIRNYLQSIKGEKNKIICEEYFINQLSIKEISKKYNMSSKSINNKISYIKTKLINEFNNQNILN